MKKCGPAFFSSAELGELVTSSYFTLLRHSLKWRMRGDREATDGSIASLRAMGFRADATDLIRAMLGYPAHLARKATSGVAVRERMEAYER